MGDVYLGHLHVYFNFFLNVQLWLARRKFLFINILHEECITWTVSSFPVLDITFRKGVAVIRGNNQPMLFNAEDAVSIHEKEKILCTKWCHITIEDVEYLVVWKFDKLLAINGESSAADQVADQAQANVGDDNTGHTLPFKVLGVSYKSR